MPADDANPSCSFCGKSKKDARKLIAGPCVYICDACVVRARLPEAERRVPTRPLDSCSFCGRRRSEVAKLIPGLTVCICDECLDLCDGILADETDRAAASSPHRAHRPLASLAEVRCSFCGEPKTEERKVVAGPTVYICKECIVLALRIVADALEKTIDGPSGADDASSLKSAPAPCCDFCGKTQKEVRRLVAGPGVYICDECLGLCADIVAVEVSR